MTADLVSLAVISLVAVLCPLVANAIPKKPVPETVFLLLAGALLGPHIVKAIAVTDAVGLLSDLGLAFLFLLAGYEIDPKSLMGSDGKRGLATWVVSFAIAIAFAVGLGALMQIEIATMAIAITLVTTALGTILPIMKERGLMGTRI